MKALGWSKFSAAINSIVVQSARSVQFEKAAALALAISMFILVVPVHAQSIVNVTFDKPIYDRDDTVNMSVHVSTAPTHIAIEVHAPSGGLVWIHEDTLSRPEVYYLFRLPGLNSSDGNYVVYVAIENSKPLKYYFTVKKPTFEILSVSPTTIAASPNSMIKLTVNVMNSGARGTFTIRVLDSSGNIVMETQTYALDYNENATYTIKLTAPAAAGTYYYTIATWNTKYGVYDDQETITVNIKAVPTTTPPPSPSPQPPPQTTITTTTSPSPATTTASPTTTTPVTTPMTTTTTSPQVPHITAITTSPIEANAVVVYVADIANVVNDQGVVINPVVIAAQDIRLKIILQEGTQILSPDGKPIKPDKLFIVVLKNPPAENETAKPVGPIVDIRIGTTTVKLTKPATLVLPFNPAMVPPGYSVKLAYFNSTLNSWIPLPTIKVDEIAGKVVGITKHFTPFAAIAFKTVKPAQTTTTKPTTPVTVTTTIQKTETITTPILTTTTIPTTVTSISWSTVPSPVEKTVTITATKTAMKTISIVKGTVTKVQRSTVTTTVTTTSPATYAAIIIAIVATVAALLAMSKRRRQQG